MCKGVLFPPHCFLITDIDSVGAEHCVLGCAAFSRLAGTSKSSDTCKPIQLSLLAVRKSSRKMGLGRYLMQVGLIVQMYST